MRETRFEYYDRIIGPDARRMAERLVDQHGADALKYWISLELEKGLSKEHEKILNAIPEVVIRRAVDAEADPLALRVVASRPEVVALTNRLVALQQLRPDWEETKDYVQTEVLALWHEAVHRRLGLKTYEVAPGLAERLAQTELRGLSTDDLKLPFESVYIQIPPEAGLTVMNIETGKHDIAGIYVTSIHDTAPGVGGVGDGEPRWGVLVWGPPKADMRSSSDDALFCFSVGLKPGVPVDEALEKVSSRIQNIPAATEAFHRDNWRKIFRFVMNVVVYITWPDARIEELIGNAEWLKLTEQLHRHPKGSSKHERARLALREIDPQRRIYLGRGTPRFEGTGASHGPLAVRTLVTGHWQRFAVGVGRAERKWGWRMPFWRGPEDTQESNPRRIVT